MRKSYLCSELSRERFSNAAGSTSDNGPIAVLFAQVLRTGEDGEIDDRSQIGNKGEDAGYNAEGGDQIPDRCEIHTRRVA